MVAEMIADGHVDLLMELAYRERRLGESNVFAETWLPLLERGGVVLQVCPIYVDVTVQPEGSLREALSMVASFHRAVRENEDRVVQVLEGADLDLVESGERIGLMLALEGVECFGVETWPADVFHTLGVRMAGLTWNRRNAFADGAAEDLQLTAVRLREAEEQTQQGRLPGPVRADQPVHLAGHDREVHAVERDDLAE